MSPAMAKERPWASVLNGLRLVPRLASFPKVGFTKKLLGKRVAVAPTGPAAAASSSG